MNDPTTEQIEAACVEMFKDHGPLAWEETSEPWKAWYRADVRKAMLALGEKEFNNWWAKYAGKPQNATLDS